MARGSENRCWMLSNVGVAKNDSRSSRCHRALIETSIVSYKDGSRNNTEGGVTFPSIPIPSLPLSVSSLPSFPFLPSYPGPSPFHSPF